MNSTASFDDDDDDDETTPIEIYCSELLCRIPFIKSTSSLSKAENRVRIDSKNAVEKEDALKLETWIQRHEVILSHSSAWHLQQHFRGVVEDFEYEETRKYIKVTICSFDSILPIWEDTDVWMRSLKNSPANSLCSNTETPNTSADDPTLDDSDPTPEEELKQSSYDMDQAELFQSINGWRMVGQVRERTRRKEGGKWRNVYLTELEMTSVDPKKQELIKFIAEKTSLRFSDDIEELGDVLVDVIRKSEEKDGELKTITVGVTGFLRRDVDIALSKETTFYLNMCDLEEDDIESLASEDEVRPGYPLTQSIDELCEKIGELTIMDVCAKTWLDERQNVCYIRLVVSSRKRMSNFKLLIGHHVTIQSTTNESQIVLAVVSRVFRDGMILTLKGTPKNGPEFFFSKTEELTIQIDHNYEGRLRSLENDLDSLENLRLQLAASESDIRFQRFWDETIGGSKKYYALFSVKNEAFLKIPFETRILLGKCWEVEGQLEKKADFVFASRVNHINAAAPLTIAFLIVNTKNLVRNSARFQISKAFYYVEFDSTEEVVQDSFYALLNARDFKSPKSETVARSCSIGAELKFYVFPNSTESQKAAKANHHNPIQRQKKRKNNNKFGGGKQDESAPRTPNETVYTIDLELKTPKKEELWIKNTKPAVPLQFDSDQLFACDPEERHVDPGKKPANFQRLLKKTPSESMSQKTINSQKSSKGQWNVFDKIGEKHKQLCFVYLNTKRCYENGNPVVKLETSYDQNGKSIKMAPWNLGKRLVLTDGVEKKEIKVTGEVTDTNGISENYHAESGQKTLRRCISFGTQK